MKKKQQQNALNLVKKPCFGIEVLKKKTCF